MRDQKIKQGIHTAAHLACIAMIVFLFWRNAGLEQRVRSLSVDLWQAAAVLNLLMDRTVESSSHCPVQQ
jgi:hypothetical protein